MHKPSYLIALLAVFSMLSCVPDMKVQYAQGEGLERDSAMPEEPIGDRVSHQLSTDEASLREIITGNPHVFSAADEIYLRSTFYKPTAGADGTVSITDGKVNITKSYEGIEAATIDVSGGSTELHATDDGFSLCENHTNRTKQNGGHDYSSNIYVNHAIEFISKFYSQSINVTSISEYIGITRAHLNNCFQKELGITVQSYLIDYRLHQASQLLSSTTDSINEIAAKVGYPDPLAFSKAFKKKYKASPKFYRQNQLELLQFNNK